MTVATYLRISYEDQEMKKAVKTESNSIANQRNLISNFIGKHPEFEHARIVEFCDDGWSGRNFERPAVRELLNQVQDGRIRCIVVKDLSRFGRNYLEVGNYISRVFPFLNVRFIAVNDNFDSSNPMAAESLEVSFKTLLHDIYSRDLSHKVKNSLRFQARQGKCMAAFAPYGYVKDAGHKNRMIPDPDAAENVRSVFRMAADGMTTLQIAREMNHRNILTPMQYKRMNGSNRTIPNRIHEDNFWTPETVIKILRDERYTGKAVFGKRKREGAGNTRQVTVNKAEWITVDHAHESIISQVEFDQAQKKLRAYAKRGTVRKTENLLHKKVRCGICGRCMMRTGSRKNPSYTCMTSCMTEVYPCPTERIAQADLLEIIQKNMREQVKYAVDSSQIWEERQRHIENQEVLERDNSEKKLCMLKQSHTRIENDIQELYEKFAFGELDRDAYVRLKKAALERYGNVSEQIEELQIKELELKMGHGKMNGRMEIRFEENKISVIEKPMKDMIADVLRAVIVYPGKRVEVVWDYRDEFSASVF